MNVAQQIAGWLDERNFKDAFGVIGSGNIAIWDAVTRLKKTKLTCFHHEQAAAQAAVFYHRATGRHAAVLVTTGAGSSNVVTGILCAWMDSTSLLVLAGNEPTFFLTQNVRAKGAQGYNFVETLTPITKWAMRMRQGADLDTLDFAYRLMCDRRCGPVVVEVPINVQNMECGK